MRRTAPEVVVDDSGEAARAEFGRAARTPAKGDEVLDSGNDMEPRPLGSKLEARVKDYSARRLQLTKEYARISTVLQDADAEVTVRGKLPVDAAAA